MLGNNVPVKDLICFPSANTRTLDGPMYTCIFHKTKISWSWEANAPFGALSLLS